MKRKLFKYLKTQFDISKSTNKDYDFDVIINDELFKLKILKIPSKALVTINSKTIWEYSKGRLDGIRFIKNSTDYINFNGFHKENNKIVFLSNKPHKVLRAINESDLEDITSKNYSVDTYIFTDFTDFEKLQNRLI